MTITCGGLNENGPLGSYIWILGFQLMNYLRRIRKCCFVGGDVLMKVDFEFSCPIHSYFLTFSIKWIRM